MRATRAKRVDDAIRVKDDAAAANVPIGPKLMTSVLRCAADVDAGRKRGAKHRLIRACRIFEEMLADGAVPPPAAFAALVSAAKRARQPDLVARTFEEMVATGVTPSRETYEDALSAVSAGVWRMSRSTSSPPCAATDSTRANPRTTPSSRRARRRRNPGWSKRSRFFTA